MNEGEDSEDGEHDEDAEDECHRLLFFWRMNRAPTINEPLVVADLFDLSINGCFTKGSIIE